MYPPELVFLSGKRETRKKKKSVFHIVKYIFQKEAMYETSPVYRLSPTCT